MLDGYINTYSIDERTKGSKHWSQCHITYRENTIIKLQVTAEECTWPHKREVKVSLLRRKPTTEECNLSFRIAFNQMYGRQKSVGRGLLLYSYCQVTVVT